MTNKALIKLIQNLNSNGITIAPGIFKRLQEMEDKELLLLYDIHNEEILEVLTLIINNSVKYYSKLKSIIESIKKSNNKYAGEMAAKAALDENLKKTSYIENIVRIISNTDYANVEATYNIAINPAVLEKGYNFTTILLKYASSANDISKANNIYKLVSNEKILNNPDFFNFVKAIFNCKNNAGGNYIVNLLYDNNISGALDNNMILELVNLISDTPTRNNLVNVNDIIEYLIDGDEILDNSSFEQISEIVKYVAFSKTPEKSDLAAQYAINFVHPYTDAWKTITRSIANAKTNMRATYAYRVAVALPIEVTENDYIGYVRAAANAKGDVQSKFVFDVVTEPKTYNHTPEGLKLARACSQCKNIPGLMKIMEKSVNNNNIDAAIALIVNGIDTKNVDDLSYLLNVLTDGENYVKFVDYYFDNQIEAAKSLEEETQIHNSQFSYNDVYVKKQKTNKNNN